MIIQWFSLWHVYCFYNPQRHKIYIEEIGMKSFLSVALAVSLAMVLATGAFAFGPAGGPGAGGGNCPMAGTNLTPEQQQKYTQFQNETLPLKQKMMQLRTEAKTLGAKTPTDWNALAAKEKEMVDVRIEMRKKAVESGFAGCGMGHGMKGRGGHGGHGAGPKGTL